MKKQDDQVIDENSEVINQTEAKPVDEENAHEAAETQEVQLWKEKYYRALADYQNLEKRSEAKRLETQAYAAENTLRRIIPAIDSLERAVKHIKDDGLALSLKEFYGVLEAIGVKKIKTIGEKFDPFAMECIQVLDNQGEIVVEEVQSGYKLHDKILRVAKVNVGLGKKI